MALQLKFYAAACAFAVLVATGVEIEARNPQAPFDQGGIITGAIDRVQQERPRRTGLELVVFERAACGICQAFRQRIAPMYLEQDAATRVPLRYVDIDGAAVGQAGLARNLTMLPTTVLMRDGEEIARLDGLLAPDHFIAVVDGMIRNAEPASAQ